MWNSCHKHSIKTLLISDGVNSYLILKQMYVSSNFIHEIIWWISKFIQIVNAYSRYNLIDFSWYHWYNILDDILHMTLMILLIEKMISKLVSLYISPFYHQIPPEERLIIFSKDMNAIGERYFIKVECIEFQNSHWFFTNEKFYYRFLHKKNNNIG